MLESRFLLRPEGPCCSMPGLPRPLVCQNSLPLTCYLLAAAASLCGMAKAPKAKPPVNATVIPLQQQDSILSSSTPVLLRLSLNAQVTCDYFQHHDLGMYGGPNTPDISRCMGLTDPDVELGPQFAAVCRIVESQSHLGEKKPLRSSSLSYE
ncbi:hypothetical protein DUI87_22948 [Hirundo rustica rustica]|uniref:Uncharacterized protein n=1 Tax=Hirundo rustica rustica TaxID=333673 RepID=A0A3M0JNP5_HIRRU|nr:hypothetical protein DUI87_22948 [Hirundo rustica rustica]